MQRRREEKMNGQHDESSAPLQPKAASIVVISSEFDAPKQINLQFSNINFSVSHRKGKWKQILHDVSGEFNSGRLTAILGPSGSGKTTLLNILADHGTRKSRGKLKGTFRINGFTQKEQPELFRKLRVCYVPQEFAMLPLLTAKETIYIAARLKLSYAGQNISATDALIKSIVERLGLQECLDTLTGNLSGGERKRLSIAVEMITSPSLMLLDEPTSGLDSTSSEQVISLLQSTAQSGCTVVCAVHQPNSQMTSCFDDLLIMSQGRCRYCGPRDTILDHFQNSGYVCPPFYNLAEFVLEVVTGRRGGDYGLICNKSMILEEETKIGDKSLDTSTDTENSEDECRRYAISRFSQAKILLHRAFICIIRDHTMTSLRLLAHLIVALLIGVVFYNFGQDASKVQSNVACLFFFAVFLFFANAMPAVQMFPVESIVFLREKTNNWYSLESYYISKILSDLPLQIMCPTGFLVIAYYMTGQPMELSRFFDTWIICTLCAIFAQLFGTVTGAAFNTHLGMFLVPALNIPMFLFAGFFLKLKEVPSYLNFISSVSYFRYIFEGIVQAAYVDRPKIPCLVDFCYLRHSKRILDELDMPSVSFSTCVFALVAWIIIIHGVTYGVLQWKLYSCKR